MAKKAKYGTSTGADAAPVVDVEPTPDVVDVEPVPDAEPAHAFNTTVPGGRYIVNGRLVNANGEPIE